MEVGWGANHTQGATKSVRSTSAQKVRFWFCGRLERIRDKFGTHPLGVAQYHDANIRNVPLDQGLVVAQARAHAKKSLKNIVLGHFTGGMTPTGKPIDTAM